MRRSLGSTSTRTFAVWPAALALEQAFTRRRPHLSGLPLLASGYALYRLAGAHRLPRAGGPPGMTGMPGRLVEDGPYRLSRNPMYTGHLVFLAGLVVTTRSPWSAGLLAAHVPWFRARVRRDEQRLRERFGPAYDHYCVQVPRWLPGPVRFAALVRRPGTWQSA
ncbi:MAG: methyltransferase family protein [Actinomycetes bacterium]